VQKNSVKVAYFLTSIWPIFRLVFTKVENSRIKARGPDIRYEVKGNRIDE